MSKLIQLKTSKTKLEQINELTKLLDLDRVHGGIQQAIYFSIAYTLSDIKRLAQVLPDLDTKKLELLLSSIRKLKKEENKQKMLANIEKTP